MTPEFYDELLASLHQAHDHARREGDQLTARVFEDATYAAARMAGELRNLARGEGVYIPGDKTLHEVLSEYESHKQAGLSQEDALAQVFPPRHRRPFDIGPCIVCNEDFVPGESAVKAPTEDEIGFTHLECLSVVIVD